MSSNTSKQTRLFVSISLLFVFVPLGGVSRLYGRGLGYTVTQEWPRETLAPFPFYAECLRPDLVRSRGARDPVPSSPFISAVRYAGEKEYAGTGSEADGPEAAGTGAASFLEEGITPAEEEKRKSITAGLLLEGEIDLNLRFGSDFSLKRGSVSGAGSGGITDGLKYDLIERVLLQGNIQERFYVEFDYDSRRTEEGLTEKRNTYSVLYRGRENEFVKEASLGNKYQSIEGSRYIPIDQGNPDSFALRGVAGWKNFTLEGLFRYEVALEGKKQFQGFRKNVDLGIPDVDYVRSRYFMLPDTRIDETSLRLYLSVLQSADITVGGKNFRLLTRGVEYDFDNSSGFLYLKEALAATAELIVYYTKEGTAVGGLSLGTGAIIDDDGVRKNFNSGTFSEYFVTDGLTYLYLKKDAFNDYWELRNVYALSEFEGQTASDITVELLYTANSGINGNYGGLLGNYTIDAARALIFFNFFDDTVPPRFYPRPFPGELPFDTALTAHPPADTARNPFDPGNPIYGGLNYPTSDSSINTLHIQYSYEATSFFLDLNLVPGSVTVTVNGSVLDPSKYDVDSAMGVVTFDAGAINSSSDVVITYKYTPFGGGDKRLFGALGITYDAGPFRIKNLSAFRTGIPGQEAPEAGTELPREFKNTTEFSLDFDKPDGERGLYGSLRGGFAFSLANRNAYGDAIVADMEKDESLFELGMDNGNWVLATVSSILPVLSTRGSVLYKNYWKKTTFEGDVLQTLAYTNPKVFSYSQKAGPYNTADELVEVDDRSLVIDYELAAGSTNAFVTVVTPIAQENLSGYERFNMILEWQGISGTDVELYVELLQSYNEDLNGNGVLDGESTINDPGFAITPRPLGSSQTRIGSDRDGNSNGTLDSEDRNGNGLLDTAEAGVIIPLNPGVGSSYPIAQGDQTWRYVAIDIPSLITANRSVFQYANALRITLRAATSPLPSAAAGKIVIDKIWFSGSGVANESTDYLSISDVSVDEDPEVRQNAFSKKFPAVYEELHGSAGYRARNDYLEKVLKVSFDSMPPGPALNGEATIARRYGAPADLSFYREFKMYLYRPALETIPAGLDFTLKFVSSQSETLSTATAIPGSDILPGWNEITVTLDPPYAVRLNGADVTTMSKTGSLQVLKRVSKVQFGFLASVPPVSARFKIWLDEWHVSGSEGTFDKAYFAEGSVSYAGTAVSVGGFALVQDPTLGAGVELREGGFTENPEYRSDRYFTDMNARLFRALDSRFSLSRENLTHFRNREDLPNGLDTDSSYDVVSHDFVLDLEKPYIPVLVHGYDRTMKRTGAIELTQASYRFKQEDTFSDTIELGERYTLPFGLTHFYTFQRRWQLQDTVTADQITGFSLSEQKTASLNQINDIFFAYAWEKGNVSLALKRDETFTGKGIPDPEAWPGSYFNKMAKIFASPGNALNGAALTIRSDLLNLDLSRPPGNSIGVNASLVTGFTASNFQPATGARDTLATSRLSFAFPFRPLESETVELIPGLERVFTADYKRAGSGVPEAEIVLGTYGALFEPPFYYAHREKEYEAADLFGSDSRIFGTSSNTLSTRSSFDALIEDNRWFVPTSLGMALYSETSRQGASYTQLRGFMTSASKYVALAPVEKAYNKSLDFSFTFKNERNYATKTVANAYTMSTGLNLLKQEWRGTKLAHAFTFERERQRLNDPGFYALPQDAVRETVAFRPFRDKIDSKVTYEYLWELGISRKSVLRRIWKNEPFESKTKNTERAILENIYTFTDREKAGSYSNIPVRFTLEHITSYRISDHVEFNMNLKTVAGVEERVLPTSPEGNTLYSMGFETGVTVKIIF